MNQNVDSEQKESKPSNRKQNIIFERIIRKLSKRWSKFLIPSKVLIIVAVLECIAIFVVGFMSLSRGTQNQTPCATYNYTNGTQQATSDPVYFISQAIALFVWAIFFSVSVFDGTFLGNIYELYAAMFLALFVSGWSISRFADKSFQNGSLDYFFLCAACAPQIFYIGVSWNLYKEYAWVLYRKAGADTMLRDLYIKYLLWSCLLKLDTVFGILSTFLSGKGVCNGGLLAFFDYFTLFICIIFLFIGYYVVQRELVMYTRLWFFLFPFLPAYNIGFLIYQYMYETIDPHRNYTEYILRALYTAAAACSLLTWVGVVYFTYIVVNNYGKGLVTLAEERKKKERKKT